MSRRPARRSLQLLTTVPWAITAEGLETLIQIANRELLDPERIAAAMHGTRGKPEGIVAVEGEPRPDASYVTMRNGVATIAVIGPLFRYASWFNAWSGASSYDLLAIAVNTVLEDPAVRAILLEVDSPGGEANGCGEFADMIYQARGAKPIVAYVSGLGASAAYWIASAADRIVVDPGAILGSIGVRMATVDTWMRDAASGVRKTEMVSKQSPRKAMAQADIQALADGLGDVFVAAVARNRDVSPEQVLAEFGQGGVFIGQAAIDAGLADEIGTYEAVHAELEGESLGVSAVAGLFIPTPLRVVRGGLASSPSDEGPMSDKPKTTEPGPGATAPAVTIEPAAPPAAPATTAPSTDEIRAQARTAERERITGIQSLARPGLEAIITACINDAACSKADTALKIVEHENRARSGRVAALAGDEQSLDAPGPIATTADGDTPLAEAQAILAVHRRLKGEKPPAKPARTAA
jgi:signal peptide peptidase SppA